MMPDIDEETQRFMSLMYLSGLLSGSIASGATVALLVVLGVL